MKHIVPACPIVHGTIHQLCGLSAARRLSACRGPERITSPRALDEPRFPGQRTPIIDSRSMPTTAFYDTSSAAESPSHRCYSLSTGSSGLPPIITELPQASGDGSGRARMSFISRTGMTACGRSPWFSVPRSSKIGSGSPTGPLRQRNFSGTGRD